MQLVLFSNWRETSGDENLIRQFSCSEQILSEAISEMIKYVWAK